MDVEFTHFTYVSVTDLQGVALTGRNTTNPPRLKLGVVASRDVEGSAGETPKASRGYGVGRGCPLPTGKSGVYALPQKTVEFYSRKFHILVHF